MRLSADTLATFIGVALLAAAGCRADDESVELGEGGAPQVDTEYETFDERPCPEENDLSFEGFGGPFLISWCNGCHASGLPEAERQGAPVGIDFDDIELIRAQAERIWARSGDHNLTMPPVGGPEDDERTMLGEWLACGAPTLADLHD
jgi:hypothetical protein